MHELTSLHLAFSYHRRHTVVSVPVWLAGIQGGPTARQVRLPGDAVEILVRRRAVTSGTTALSTADAAAQKPGVDELRGQMQHLDRRQAVLL